MKPLALFLILAFFISGCSFSVHMVTPAPVEDHPSMTPDVSMLTPTPIISQTEAAPLPTLVPDAFFRHTFFTLDPVNGAGQWTFPAGTKQLFAVWEYQGMQAGMTVKREWLLNGKPWLTREEPWDFAKYGSNGMIRDISIYDNDLGLPSGAYQLSLYVNNIPQPIGMNLDGSAKNWTSFEILPAQIAPEVYSYDTQSSAAILDGKTLIVRDASNQPKVLFSGRELHYVTWLPDNQHVVFLDRDRSGQQGTTTIGVRDDLLIVDIQTANSYLLYKSPTALGGQLGFIPSPDSQYIASTEGSGFGDACVVDSHLIFFQLANDFESAAVIKQEQFTGILVIKDSSIYPAEVGAWKTNRQYFTKLSATCTTQADLGMYSFDVSTLKSSNVSTGTTIPVAGDLGWGTIHGKVTDAASGAPIVGAQVTCEHHSYTSPYPCSGTALTNADGTYAFNNIFFHDTDTIKLTVLAPGYQNQDLTQASFTQPGLEANIFLKRFP